MDKIRDALAQQSRQNFWLTIAATAAIAGTLVLALTSLPELGGGLLAAAAVATFKASRRG